MGDKVGSSTNAPAPAAPAAPQNEEVNPFKTAPVPKGKGEAVSNPKSEKGSKQHATQMREHKKLEGSLKEAEVRKDYSSAFNDADKLDPGYIDRTKMYHPDAVSPYAKTPSVSEARETKIVEANKGKGKLVDLSPGKPDRPMTVTIHGINGSPNTVKSLSERAVRAGDAVKTFAYDDADRKLWKSSKDLSDNLEKWCKDNPGRPLRIDAHSMGGRVAMHALDTLEQKGLLKDRKVELNLVASPINGTKSGELAMSDPGLFPDKPWKDMAPSGGFQKELNNIRFNDNVKVRVFTGGNDDIVNRDADFNKMCKNLKAEKHHFKEANHDSTVDEAADWLSKHNR
ncbi:alpha/beta hydrolase [bacterium]|nr:alpha/beta hydrolase [bacterium]